MSDGRRHYCVVLQRRPDVTREDFLRLWLDEHRALARELPGVESVVFLPTVDEDPLADGVGILTFGSAEVMKVALVSDVAERLRAHTETFARSADATRLTLRDPDG